MKSVLFKHINVIPMDEEKVLENVDVLVVDGRISRIGPDVPPENAEVVWCDGKYLIPGLCDMHMHLNVKGDLDLYLPNGVTTIRNMWGEPAFNVWRDQIKAGEFNGPTVYNCGQILDGDPPVRQADKYNVTLRTPAEGKSEVYRLKEEGYDFIKVYTNLPMDIYDAVAASSKECEMKFIGHVPPAVGFQHVVESDQHSIEHIAYVTMDDVELAARSGIWICPTVIVQDMITSLHIGNNPELLLEDDRLKYMDDETRVGWKMAYTGKEELAKIEAFQAFLKKASYEKAKPVVRKAHETGCRFILGTDTGNPFIYPGFAVHDELELMVDCGLTPYDALKTATSNPAECLEILDITGTVQEGKTADLVLLEADPLENIAHTRRISGVMKSGRWFDEQAIAGMLEAAEQRE
jgi:imidazolonepropionase-like amidohydrolase